MVPEETKKEKRAASRQARIEAQRARERARKRKRRVSFGLIALVVALVAFFGVQNALRTKAAITRSATQAGCETLEPEDEGRLHLQETDPTPDYKTKPPTSGPHLGSQPPPGGIHDTTQDARLLVHNLEHGYVVIHHKGISDDDLGAIHDLVESYDDGVISQPNPDIDRPIVMTSWGHIQKCKKLSINVIRAYIKDRCNKGPEKFNLAC